MFSTLLFTILIFRINLRIDVSNIILHDSYISFDIVNILSTFTTLALILLMLEVLF